MDAPKETKATVIIPARISKSYIPTIIIKESLLLDNNDMID